MKDEKLYLIHIWESIGRIQNYVHDGKAVFYKSPMIQDAALRNRHTLAESTQRLSEDLKKQHAGVDWRGIAGFCNVLVHDYLGIDLDYVWRVIEHDLPDLKKKIWKVLEEQGGLPGDSKKL